jgi:hypothetical protein
MRLRQSAEFLPAMHPFGAPDDPFVKPGAQAQASAQRYHHRRPQHRGGVPAEIPQRARVIPDIPDVVPRLFIEFDSRWLSQHEEHLGQITSLRAGR